jgi:hypothetical protein
MSINRSPQKGGASCQSSKTPSAYPAFERSSKRRKGFPSETKVKRGDRVVHGDVELSEKLGRKDLCPCGSRRLFQGLLHEERPLSMEPNASTIGGRTEVAPSWRT